MFKNNQLPGMLHVVASLQFVHKKVQDEEQKEEVKKEKPKNLHSAICMNYPVVSSNGSFVELHHLYCAMIGAE